MRFNTANSRILAMIWDLKKIAEGFKVPTHCETEAQFNRRAGWESQSGDLAGKSVNELMGKMYIENYLPILDGDVKIYYERFYAMVSLDCVLQALDSYRRYGCFTPDFYTSNSLWQHFRTKNLDIKLLGKETCEIYTFLAKLSAVFLDAKYSSLRYGSRSPAIDKELRSDLEMALNQ